MRGLLEVLAIAFYSAEPRNQPLRDDLGRFGQNIDQSRTERSVYSLQQERCCYHSRTGYVHWYITASHLCCQRILWYNSRFCIESLGFGNELENFVTCLALGIPHAYFIACRFCRPCRRDKSWWQRPYCTIPQWHVGHATSIIACANAFLPFFLQQSCLETWTSQSS